MIPKTIHYCWFGHAPLPQYAVSCIESWKKYLPDYEIMRWDESNFNVNINEYTKQAYENRKYAFVSDYARYWILYHYGGVYFDTDVEVIKPLDDILSKGPYMGLESDFGVSTGTPWDTNPLPLLCNPGLGMAAEPGMVFFRKMLEQYSSLRFVFRGGSLNLVSVVTYTTKMLLKEGLIPSKGIMFFMGINIYPKEYFCPTIREDGTIDITKNTVSIHHYAATWKDSRMSFKGRIAYLLVKVLPLSFLRKMRGIYHLLIGRMD